MCCSDQVLYPVVFTFGRVTPSVGSSGIRPSAIAHLNNARNVLRKLRCANGVAAFFVDDALHVLAREQHRAASVRADAVERQVSIGCAKVFEDVPARASRLCRARLEWRGLRI